MRILCLLAFAFLSARHLNSAPVFTTFPWHAFTYTYPERDAFVASFPSPVTVIDFESGMVHPRIVTAQVIDTDPFVGFCCTAGGVGQNTTPGGIRYLSGSAMVTGAISLHFLTPIDHLAIFATGLLAPEYNYFLRVFDGAWHEQELFGTFEQGIGFSAPGSEVTVVQLVSMQDPDFDPGCCLSDRFGIDDLYVHFTRDPAAVPEPFTFGLVLGGMGVLVTWRRSRLH